MEMCPPILKGIKVECTDEEFQSKPSDSYEYVNYYDNQLDVLDQLKRDISEEESSESTRCSFTNKRAFKADKALKLVDKRKSQSDYYEEYEEEDEELILSVKVKYGDKKYQGKRKPERPDVQRLSDKTKNTNVHYDALVTTGQVPCKFCGKIFKNNFNLLKHNIGHMKLDVYTPDAIMEYENKRKKVEARFKKEYKTKLYHCKYCDKCYNRYGHWRRHLKTVHSENKYKCGFCGKKFSCLSYVRRHMKVIHIVTRDRKTIIETKKICRCWCRESFDSVIELNRHRSKCHKFTPLYNQSSL